MPMLPLHLFRLRNFCVANIETFSVYGGLSGLSVFVALFLESYAHYSAFGAGVATSPDHER